jgi:transcription elongation factor Elf1
VRQTNDLSSVTAAKVRLEGILRNNGLGHLISDNPYATYGAGSQYGGASPYGNHGDGSNAGGYNGNSGRQAGSNDNGRGGFVGFGGPVLPPARPTATRSIPSAVGENLNATGSKLKDIDKFRGDETDRKDYKFWRRAAKNFLAKTNIHTTVQDQLDYVIDHLRGPAAEKVEYRSRDTARNRYVTVAEVFSDLDRVYDTGDSLNDANALLYQAKGTSGSLHQADNESLDDWFGRFTSAIAPLDLTDDTMVQHAVRLMKYGINAGQQHRRGDTWEQFTANCRHQAQLRKLASPADTRNNSNTSGRGGRGGSNSSRGGRGGSNNSGGDRTFRDQRTKTQIDRLSTLGECFKCGGTKNKEDKKHRAQDADAPCKNAGMTPAKYIPCLKATVNSYAARVEEDDEDGGVDVTDRERSGN